MTLVGFFVPVDPPSRKTARKVAPPVPAEGATPMRSEAEILQAMASGSLQDQRALLIELEALRGARTASLQADREVDLGFAVMADHLTPVLTHEHHTAATDWILEDDLFAPDTPEGDPAQIATVEASMWFGRVSPEVKADRSEFAEQAMGMARVVAGKFGERARLAERAFLDHVSHLHGKTANEIDGEEAAEDAWPLDPGGPMKPSIETGEIDNPAIKTAEMEDWPVDPNAMENPNVLPWDAPPETTGDTREAAFRRMAAMPAPSTPEELRAHLTSGGHNRTHMGDVGMDDMKSLHNFEHSMGQGAHSHPDIGRRKPNPVTNRGSRTATGDAREAAFRVKAWTPDESDVTPMARKLMDLATPHIRGSYGGYDDPKRREDIERVKGVIAPHVHKVTDADQDVLEDYNYHTLNAAIDQLKGTSRYSSVRTTGDAREAAFRQAYMGNPEPKFKKGDKVVNFRGEGPFIVHDVIKVDQPGKSHRVQLDPHGTAYYEEGFEHYKASRTAAGDSPGQVDEDQSGNAESTITDYETDADQEPWLADDWPETDETGPVAVHPPMPGAGEATARRVRAADEEDQSGEGLSSFPEVGVTDPQAQMPMWPWEIGEPSDEMVGPSGEEGTGAADVADVPTPGGEAGYPQPKESAKIKAFRNRVQRNLEQTRRTR